jgi:hypothetical protein
MLQRVDQYVPLGRAWIGLEDAWMSAQRTVVEFLGGPLDGHQQLLAVPAAELNGVASFPINRNLFRLMGRRPGGKPHPVTSVALYRLEMQGERLVYRFQLAGSPVAV